MPTPPKEHQWKPGKSGNPGGRQRGAPRRARDAAAARSYVAKDGKTYTGHDALMHVLLDIAFDDTEKARDRIQAAGKALDRGWGTVTQSVEITSDAVADGAQDFDPSEMTDADLRSGLAAIATLRRLGVAAETPEGDGSTEH